MKAATQAKPAVRLYTVDEAAQEAKIFPYFARFLIREYRVPLIRVAPNSIGFRAYRLNERGVLNLKTAAKTHNALALVQELTTDGAWITQKEAVKQSGLAEPQFRFIVREYQIPIIKNGNRYYLSRKRIKEVTNANERHLAKPLQVVKER